MKKQLCWFQIKEPQNLLGFPERLVSRILNGSSYRIGKPDKEMFEKMLKIKNEEFGGVLLTKKEVDEILNVEVNSFRDISGIVNNLVIKNKPVLVILNILKPSFETKKNVVAYLSPDYILDYVSDVYQVDKKLIVSKNRSSNVVSAKTFVFL